MKNAFWVFLLPVLVFAQATDEPKRFPGTKLEYYNTVLAPARGLKPLPTAEPMMKAAGAADRKRAVMDVGNVWARLSNGATLGYDRWGLCYEFPAKSGITYRWTMAPLIGAMRRDGAKMVASGTRGAARFSEEEFQPLGGFDAGVVDEPRNIGFALSDIPESWPSTWPNTQPLSALPPHARKLEGVGASYTQPPVGSGGFPGIVNGEVRATREGYFVVTDNDPVDFNKPSPMDIRVDMWSLQWDDILNQNFIIFKMFVTNVGVDTLFDVYIGIHDDPDCPEQGAAEWTDDFAAYIPIGTDVPGYNTNQDSLLWNFTYVWDGDNTAGSVLPTNVGWVGLKFLETPDDPTTGNPRGVTTFQVFEYSAAPQSEATEYDQLAVGIMPPQNVSPHPEDYTQTPNSYGPDITYVVASGPFTLAPGEKLNFAFATIHGSNKSDLFNSAILCQLLYNANYLSAEPPPEPQVNVAVADREVRLYWDERSEKGIYYKRDGTVDHVNDRLTGTNAFQGYAIYKSTDRGVTWGDRITDIRGGFKYWRPLVQYDLVDGIEGVSPSDPYFILGDETGLKHTFVDRNVYNGYEYWYAVCAYDADDFIIPPLLNSIKADRRQLGGNTVIAVPAAPPQGQTPGSLQATTLIQGQTTVSPGLTVHDPARVENQTYHVSITVPTPGDKRYSVTYAGTGATVIVGLGDTLSNLPLYSTLLDNAPIFGGIRLEMKDQSNGVRAGFQSQPPSPVTMRLAGTAPYTDGMPGRDGEHDYEVIFADPAVQDTLWSWGARIPDPRTSSNPRTLLRMPIYIRNLTTGERVIPLIADQGDSVFNMNMGDTLAICALKYDTLTTIAVNAPLFTRRLNATAADMNVMVWFDATSTFSKDQRFTINTYRPLKAGDIFAITTAGQASTTIKESDLEITAVPNPYVVSSYYETGSYGLQKELQFHHLPPRCTIRIFNVAGDLVRTLYHDAASASDPTITRWDLQNYNGQEVAYGIYVFHVDVPSVGEYVGKLAIIK